MDFEAERHCLLVEVYTFSNGCGKTFVVEGFASHCVQALVASCTNLFDRSPGT